jgi:hypothetical protein
VSFLGDTLFNTLLDFLIPKTPWRVFVLLIVLGSIAVLYVALTGR